MPTFPSERMKPLRMSEGQEESIRVTLATAMVKPTWTESRALLAEVDALRAKLAEVEAERDEAKGLLASLREAHYTVLLGGEADALRVRLADTKVALAASQARERELRDVLTDLRDNVLLWTSDTDHIPLRHITDIEPVNALLSRPTDDSALRELCGRVVVAGVRAYLRNEDGFSPEEWLDLLESDTCREASEAVNEVLGPGAEPTINAQDTGEGVAG